MGNYRCPDGHRAPEPGRCRHPSHPKSKGPRVSFVDGAVHDPGEPPRRSFDVPSREELERLRATVERRRS